MNRRTFIQTLASLAAIPLVDDSKKFCSFCREQGLKSRIEMLSCQATLIAEYAYWDENGTYHYPNRNKTTCQFRCSNGHEWSE